MEAEHSYERCLQINRLQHIPCYTKQLLLCNTTVYSNNNNNNNINNNNKICKSHHIADIVVQNYSHNTDQKFNAHLPHTVI